MKRGWALRRAGWAMAAAMAIAAVAAAGETHGWRVGIGTSFLIDAEDAGAEAAARAREQYGQGDVGIVLVFAARRQVTPELVRGVARHFPANLVYGGEVAAPLTPITNFPDAKDLDVEAGVGVLALGGDVGITIVSDTTDLDDEDAFDEADDDDAALVAYRRAGLRVGQQLAPAVAACHRPGKLIFTHGDQYNGSNRAFAVGMQEGLGGPAAIVGGAAGNRTAAEIVAGEIKRAMNFAVLFCGDFTVGQSLVGGPHMPETADKALATALEQGNGEKPFFAFLYNCRRRRMAMIDQGQLGAELAVFQRRLEGVPFFGAYGPGEIGVEAPGEPAKGTGFSVVTALLFPVRPNP